MANSAHTPSRFAFTLIEVLVVVAVIALLVSILLPSLARAREQARIAVCAANLKTTGHATLFYMQSNREFLPASGQWSELVHPYVQKLSQTQFTGVEATSNGGVDQAVPFYICPSDVIRAPTSQTNRRVNGQVRTNNYIVSYAMNGFCVWQLANPAQAAIGRNFNLVVQSLGRDSLGNIIWSPLRNTSSWKRQPDIVLLSDAGNDDMGLVEEVNWDFDDDLDPTASDMPVLEVHHRTGNNFLFADQHVGYVKVTGRRPSSVQVSSLQPGSYGVPRFPHRWIPINFNY